MESPTTHITIWGSKFVFFPPGNRRSKNGRFESRSLSSPWLRAVFYSLDTTTKYNQSRSFVKNKNRRPEVSVTKYRQSPSFFFILSTWRHPAAVLRALRGRKSGGRLGRVVFPCRISSRITSHAESLLVGRMEPARASERQEGNQES